MILTWLEADQAFLWCAGTLPVHQPWMTSKYPPSKALGTLSPAIQTLRVHGLQSSRMPRPKWETMPTHPLSTLSWKKPGVQHRWRCLVFHGSQNSYIIDPELCNVSTLGIRHLHQGGTEEVCSNKFTANKHVWGLSRTSTGFIYSTKFLSPSWMK